MEYTTACKFCGQVQIVVAGEGLNEEELEKLASLQCKCDEALGFQKIEQKKTYAEANIKRLFGEDCKTLCGTLLHVVQPLACQAIKKISVTDSEGIRATLTAKENSIKIERIEVNKSSLED